MHDAESIIEAMPERQRAVARALHQLCADELGLRPEVRYRLPFYYRSSWICFISPLKNGAVELGFTRGNELTHSAAHLASKGRKQVYGIEYAGPEDIKLETLLPVLHEAIVLDETVPYSVRRKS